MDNDNYSSDGANYVTLLENKLHELRNEVRRLKSDNRGKKSSKDELRRTYRWTEADLMFSDQVITFAKEYLFPRFKFLNKGWIQFETRKEKSFSYREAAPTNPPRQELCQRVGANYCPYDSKKVH